MTRLHISKSGLNERVDMEKAGLPDYVKRVLDTYRTAADELAVIFLRQLGFGEEKGPHWWWVSDTAKDILCFNNGELYVSPEDMMLTIEHGLTFEQFDEWYWQWVEIDGRCINLRSWIKGARPDKGGGTE